MLSALNTAVASRQPKMAMVTSESCKSLPGANYATFTHIHHTFTTFISYNTISAVGYETAAH